MGILRLEFESLEREFGASGLADRLNFDNSAEPGTAAARRPPPVMLRNSLRPNIAPRRLEAMRFTSSSRLGAQKSLVGLHYTLLNARDKAGIRTADCCGTWNLLLREAE